MAGCSPSRSRPTTSPDFPWDSDNATRLFEMTARYGLPYFQNFLNSDMQPNQVRSMCCRLQLDVRELLKRGNGLFGSAEQTGSLGVVTINCARLGYRHRGDAAGLYRQLDHLLELAFASLELKRKVIQQHMDAGLYPYTRRYLGTLRNHFSTIGVNGLHEMVRNFSDDREELHSEAGREMALALLDHVRARLVGFQENSGHLYNLEATPAEGTTYRFAREDRKRYPRILQAGTPEAPYQTPRNCRWASPTTRSRRWSCRTPCNASTPAAPCCISTWPSGFPPPKPARPWCAPPRSLPPAVPDRHPTFSICPRHGYLAGEHEFCPKCDEELLQRSTPKSCCGGCGG